MVQSARVQQVVKGDDVTLTHQIMQDVAYNAEVGRTPVEVNEGDVVKFFYPYEDTTTQDIVGFTGTPVGSYPTSKFTVDAAGDIPSSPPTAERGTKLWQSGPARTVRAEITRAGEVTTLETHYLIAEVDVYERGFPVSLDDTSGGEAPPPANLNLP